MINHIVQGISAAIVCDRHNYTYCTNNYRVIVTGLFYIMRVTSVPGLVLFKWQGSQCTYSILVFFLGRESPLIVLFRVHANSNSNDNNNIIKKLRFLFVQFVFVYLFILWFFFLTKGSMLVRVFSILIYYVHSARTETIGTYSLFYIAYLNIHRCAVRFRIFFSKILFYYITTIFRTLYHQLYRIYISILQCNCVSMCVCRLYFTAGTTSRPRSHRRS